MISRAFALSLLSAVVAWPVAAQTLGAPTVPDAGFAAPAAPPAAAPAPDGAAAPAAAKPKPRAKPRAVAARETAIPTDPTPTYTPDTMVATALASEKYLAIVEAGGWPRVQALAPGAKGPAVAALRRRLVLTEDLPPSAENGGGYDAEVTAGVKRFQMRHGLRQSGTVSGRTLEEMNVSAAQRFRQLASSAQRLAGSQFPFGQRYVVVNIPSAFVEATENNQVVRRYVAVVGKADRASPVVETRITTVNLNPTWTVPTSIIKKDIVPKMQKDPGYLARSKIRLLDGSGQEINPRTINWSSERTPNFTFRQDPGAGNSLGQMRIDMPNKHAVYMHDTPSKKLFASDQRFHSSGCVRVENVRDFAVWLLGPQGGWSRGAIDEGIADKERKDIRLRTPVPVAWVYMTGYAMADGSVHFRPDVYGWDKVGGSVTASQTLVQ
ncbi:MAG: L,D-transpeptidase family protein [Bosea sp. (in: a-proteobacteria)]